MLKSNRSVCDSHTTYCKILLLYLMVKAKTNLASGYSTLKICSIMLLCTELILLLYCFCCEVLNLYVLALYHHDLIIFRKIWLTKNKKNRGKNLQIIHHIYITRWFCLVVRGFIGIPINHDMVWKRYVSRYVFVVLVHSETFVCFLVCPGNVACNWSKTDFLSEFLLWYIK